MRIGLFLAAILVTLPSLSYADERPDDPIDSNHCSDVPGRTEPLVKDAGNALRIGYAMFRAAGINPKNESGWKSAVIATLRAKDCVWEIREKPTRKYPESNFVMGLGALDGRFLGILMLE